MKKNSKNKIPAFELFLRYMKNEMTGSERNAFERQLQKDSFSEEALEGLGAVLPGDSEHDINIIRNRIRARSTRKSRFTIYRIAATVAVLMIISSVFIVLEKDKPQKDSAISDVKTLEIVKSQPIKAPEPLQEEKIQSDYVASGAEKSTTSTRVLPSEKESVMKEYRFDEATGGMPAAAVTEEPPQDEAIHLKDQNLYASFSVKIIAGADSEKAVAKEEVTQPAWKQDNRVLRRNKLTRQDLPADYVPPVPAYGKEAFIRFLMVNLKKSISLQTDESYSATVIFKVRSDGSLDSIIATESSDPRFSDEVIKIIKSGPAWTPALSGGTSIDEEVTVIIGNP